MISTPSKHDWKLISVVDVRVAVLVSIASFALLRAVHTVIRFQSLGLVNAIGATAIFVLMTALWGFTAIRLSRFRFEQPVNPPAWLIAAALTVFWWLVSSPVGSSFFSRYAPEFPTQLIDAGGDVAADTFHHSSMIFSIMNFGYPSTGLDGTPFTPYHVLSHYADAVLLSLSGLHPLDSAGMFLQLKVLVFVTAVLLLMWVLFRDSAAWVQIAVPMLVLPAFTASWHVVGSHGLWLTSLLVVVSTPFVWRLVSSSTAPTGRSLVLLGLLGAALSVGKISTGFMFMFVVGLLLWLGHLKNWRIYALGISWGTFMVTYASMIASDRPDASAVSLTLTERLVGVAKLLLLRDSSWSVVLGVYALLVILGLFTFIYRGSLHWRLLAVGALAGSFLVVLAGAMLDKNDRFYFGQALYFILLTITLSAVALSTQDQSTRRWARFRREFTTANVVAAAAMIVIAVLAPQSSFRILHPSLTATKYWLEAAFRPGIPPASATGRLTDFSKELDSFASGRNLDAHNAQLFIPRELWAEVGSIAGDGNDPEKMWSLPLMVYAETGIPLYKGVYERHASYGFSAYGDESLTPTRAEFESTKICGDNAIIEVTSWSPAKFTLACEASQ